MWEHIIGCYRRRWVTYTSRQETDHWQVVYLISKPLYAYVFGYHRYVRAPIEGHTQVFRSPLLRIARTLQAYIAKKHNNNLGQGWLET
jgi:hypothetical protein